MSGGRRKPGPPPCLHHDTVVRGAPRPRSARPHQFAGKLLTLSIVTAPSNNHAKPLFTACRWILLKHFRITVISSN